MRRRRETAHRPFLQARRRGAAGRSPRISNVVRDGSFLLRQARPPPLNSIVMKSKLYPASAIAVAATLSTALLSAQGSGAAAQATSPEQVKLEPSRTISRPVVQPIPDEEVLPEAAVAEIDVPASSSLADMVVNQAQTENLSPELRCLAGAIYFEAKSESLPGQLAVGRVVVNRAKSGRFPASYCGVVYQPSQFSFVRGR